MPLSPNPDTFHPLVWRIVQAIPHGTVSTYGQIASMIPAPDGISDEDFRRLGPKWVGDALNAVSFRDVAGESPAPSGIAWWRVINSKGGISMPTGSQAAKQQRAMLEAEGVTFNATEQTDLDTFGWDGPLEAWLAANGLLAPKPIRKPPNTPTQLSLF